MVHHWVHHSVHPLVHHWVPGTTHLVHAPQEQPQEVLLPLPQRVQAQGAARPAPTPSAAPPLPPGR